MSRRFALLVPLVLGFGFAVAHTQSPAFYSNQNQYLLHGLARADYGHLNGDWLANTKDPTPLFSVVVAGTYRLAGLAGIQGEFFLLVVGYFLAVGWLVESLPGWNPRWPARLGWAVLFTAAHAAILRLASVELTGVDYPWYFQAGVAGQYLVGPGLQPSAFGVLLVAGLAAFAAGRPLLAAGLTASAALVHATYLLPAGLLTAGYLIELWREGRARSAVCAGILALAVVAPVVAYTLVVFPPTDPATFAEAQRILAEVRIPHHAVVARWLDPVAVAQLLWSAVGIALVRKTRLFAPLAAAALGGLVLTLAQLGTGNHTLALLFPWRVSAVLVPVATAVIAARAVAWADPGRRAVWAFLGLFVALVAGGVVVMFLGLGYQVNEEERGLLAFVRETARPGDVYLIPARFPAVGAGRGSVSTSFTPPPRPKPGSNLIPVDLQRFRLATGAAIYVDFKSVPYADAEVLEWHRRLTLCQKWYDTADWDAAGVRGQLAAEGITHVVVPRHLAVKASFLEPVYSDEAYAVYRVR